MLDVVLFREEKGGQPDLIRESQRRRYADPETVQRVIDVDEQWRALRMKLDHISRTSNNVSKAVGEKMKKKEPVGEVKEIPDDLLARLADISLEECKDMQVSQLRLLSKDVKKAIEETKKAVAEKEAERDTLIHRIGNLVHESVPVSNDEANNVVEREIGEMRAEKEGEGDLRNHVELMYMLDGIECEKGAMVAGSRGFYIKGDLYRMALALYNYGINFLAAKGSTPLYTPFFMRQSMMAEVAQLEQFDEELYKVTGEGDDKYLIATSEQTVAAFHRGEWIKDQQLPIKYCGASTCFRKEVGSHGRDTLGIFRVHQFEKVEQFVLTSPRDNESWKMMDEMMSNSEEFYKSLGVSYRVVNIVSGELNNAAAKKLDLEAWFPGSKAFRELVSCSNCTDYQSRRLGVRYLGAGSTTASASGSGAGGAAGEGEKEFVHMLNATLCAVTRALCCVVETHQTPEGIVVPEVLRPFMCGTEFIPFAVSYEDACKVLDKGQPQQSKKGKKK